MKNNMMKKWLLLTLVLTLTIGCFSSAAAITFSSSVVQVETRDIAVELQVTYPRAILLYGDPVTITAVLTGEAPEEVAYIWSISYDDGETWEILEDEHESQLVLICTQALSFARVNVDVVPRNSAEGEAAAE